MPARKNIKKQQQPARGATTSRSKSGQRQQKARAKSPKPDSDEENHLPAGHQREEPPKSQRKVTKRSRIDSNNLDKSMQSTSKSEMAQIEPKSSTKKSTAAVLQAQSEYEIQYAFT